MQGLAPALQPPLVPAASSQPAGRKPCSDRRRARPPRPGWTAAVSRALQRPEEVVPAVAVQAPQRRPADPEDSSPVAARRPCWRRLAVRVLAPVMVRAPRQPQVAVTSAQSAVRASQRLVARAESSRATARTPCWRLAIARSGQPAPAAARRPQAVVVAARSPSSGPEAPLRERQPQLPWSPGRADPVPSSQAEARTPCWDRRRGFAVSQAETEAAVQPVRLLPPCWRVRLVQRAPSPAAARMPC